MFRFRVRNRNTDSEIYHEGPYEFGRGPQRDVERCVLVDPMVSRNQLRVEELDNGYVRLNNTSRTNPVLLDNGSSVDTGGILEAAAPLSLSVGRTTIRIDVVRDRGAKPPGETDDEELDTVLAPWCHTDAPNRALQELGDAPSAQVITQWLETALLLQQSAESLADLYDRTARAVVELVGLDFAQVLIRDGQHWNVLAECAKNPNAEVRVSRTLLARLVDEGRTFFRSPEEMPATESLRNTSAVVVSPIFGVENNVIGALYGAKAGVTGLGLQQITDLEAQIVQLFAAATSTRRAKSEATRMRAQFEQFFSSTLVDELRRNPDLLEGRMQEITVLVSDLRGFSRLSEQLGPEKACKVVRDVMERFTTQIIDHGGVIVDYAGDGILAMWNAPVAQADHAQRACRAALAIRDELPALNDRWESLVGEHLDAGIGVNTGTALVGNTGSNRKLKYGPHGHTVNLASRLQDVTKKLSLPVLITSCTRERLSGEFATRRLCTASIRGIRDTAVIHELHGWNPPASWLKKSAAYEEALTQFESGEWCRACQSLLGLMELSQTDDQYDIPTIKLLQKTWECLERRENINPIIDLS